jgi:hypothetical protein
VARVYVQDHRRGDHRSMVAKRSLEERRTPHNAASSSRCRVTAPYTSSGAPRFVCSTHRAS